MSAYFAVIHNEEGGGYYADFPDLPGCLTQGRTLEALDANLRDALFVYLDGLRELGDPLPDPSPYATLLPQAQAEEDFHSLTLVSVPAKVSRERINVSLSTTELEAIDAAAAANSMKRSEFMVTASLEKAKHGSASC